MITRNEKGEYALYDQGRFLGFAPVKYIGNVRVLESMYDKVLAIQQSAKEAGVNLTLAAGFRTWDEQMNLRRLNIKDPSKVNDLEYLVAAPPDQFHPRTGKPGWSNHQDGKAYDFHVTGLPEVYRWLVHNAHMHGFIRTVQSERWHWEYILGADQFAYVAKSDVTWDGLV